MFKYLWPNLDLVDLVVCPRWGKKTDSRQQRLRLVFKQKTSSETPIMSLSSHLMYVNEQKLRNQNK